MNPRPAETDGENRSALCALRQDTQDKPTGGVNAGPTKAKAKTPPFAEGAPFLRQGKQDGAPARDKTHRLKPVPLKARNRFRDVRRCHERELQRPHVSPAEIAGRDVSYRDQARKGRADKTHRLKRVCGQPQQLYKTKPRRVAPFGKTLRTSRRAQQAAPLRRHMHTD